LAFELHFVGLSEGLEEVPNKICQETWVTEGTYQSIGQREEWR